MFVVVFSIYYIQHFSFRLQTPGEFTTLVVGKKKIFNKLALFSSINNLITREKEKEPFSSVLRINEAKLAIVV